MKKIDLSHTYERYEDFERDYHDELLQAALDAIDPDAMGMTRDQALTLAGSMKAAGCNQQQFADIMSRSTARLIRFSCGRRRTDRAGISWMIFFS